MAARAAASSTGTSRPVAAIRDDVRHAADARRDDRLARRPSLRSGRRASPRCAMSGRRRRGQRRSDRGRRASRGSGRASRGRARRASCSSAARRSPSPTTRKTDVRPHAPPWSRAAARKTSCALIGTSRATMPTSGVVGAEAELLARARRAGRAALLEAGRGRGRAARREARRRVPMPSASRSSRTRGLTATSSLVRTGQQALDADEQPRPSPARSTRRSTCPWYVCTTTGTRRTSAARRPERAGLRGVGVDDVRTERAGSVAPAPGAPSVLAAADLAPELRQARPGSAIARPWSSR